MNHLTDAGQHLVNDISARYGLSHDSTMHLLIAVNNGGGTMAQFSIPEYGSGQWMQGGMTMVGDMFNYGLQANVNALCGELANALASQQIFKPRPAGPNGSNNWWPSELGTPSSSGSQNNSRYAIFPHVNRLAVEIGGQMKVFDTLNHQIGGVSQQQGSNDSLTFSSQLGTFSTLSLPLVSGEMPAPQPVEPIMEPNQQNSDVFDSIRKLGELRDAGVLSDSEFEQKKSDLLNRI